MIYHDLSLKGAILIELERIQDERGYFARTFSAEEFAARGLATTVAQCSVSSNIRRGTLRGLHFQAPPYEEAKLVRCTAGAIFDVILDIRPTSPSFGQWLGIELSPTNGKMLYVPAGFAHGFQTLADHTEVFYQISVAYLPEAARGIKWDDPAIGIAWPMPPAVISARDRDHPMLADAL